MPKKLFQPGQSGNPYGRPKKRITIDDLLADVPVEDWKAILAKQVAKAKKGDRLAAVFCFEYQFGRPKQSMDVTTAGRALNLGAEIDYSKLSQSALDEILQNTRLIDNEQPQQ